MGPINKKTSDSVRWVQKQTRHVQCACVCFGSSLHLFWRGPGETVQWPGVCFGGVLWWCAGCIYQMVHSDNRQYGRPQRPSPALGISAPTVPCDPTVFVRRDCIHLRHALNIVYLICTSTINLVEVQINLVVEAQSPSRRGACCAQSWRSPPLVRLLGWKLQHCAARWMS